MTQMEQEVVEPGTRKGGGYVILKEITDPEDLTKILANGEAPVYAVYNERVAARDGASAVKTATVGEETVDEGVYVPVPVGSFKPRRVRQVVQVTLD